MDPRGTDGEEALGWWGVAMWWLCGVDGPFPIGDAVYLGGAIIIAAVSIATTDNSTIDSVMPPSIIYDKDDEDPEPPDVPYPGDDPTVVPDGTEWRGNGPRGSKEGNYHNPKTGENFHPDLNHPDPIGPHWDYDDPNGNSWRLFKNNIPQLK